MGSEPSQLSMCQLLSSQLELIICPLRSWLKVFSHVEVSSVLFLQLKQAKKKIQDTHKFNLHAYNIKLEAQPYQSV